MQADLSTGLARGGYVQADFGTGLAGERHTWAERAKSRRKTNAARRNYGRVFLEMEDDTMEKRFGISDAARQVGVEAHVLRYWEDELGLAIPRNGQGHRYYREQDIHILHKIRDWKEQGFVLLSCFYRIEDESRR